MSNTSIVRTTQILLVNTDMSYDELLIELKRRHPDCRSTSKSIASIACDLRKKGFEVKHRRQASTGKDLSEIVMSADDLKQFLAG